jgi:hypothetical protein
MSSRQDNGGGLSASTLAIASLSSLAAALVVHKFWQGGAIVGAAVTPVIVAIVSEALRKPVDAVKARTTTVNPPPVVPDPATSQARAPREDRFGIWEAPRKRRLHVGVAIATGLVAFAIAAFFLTGAELVLGGASDHDKFRVLPGKQEQRDRGDRDRDAPAQTQPDEEDPAPVPEETTPEEVPEETAPPEVPEETTPEEVPPETVVPPAVTTPEQPAP